MFSYWFKFQYYYWFWGYDNFGLLRDLTKNSKIENATARVLSKMVRLSYVRATKFGMNVSNERLLNAEKF